MNLFFQIHSLLDFVGLSIVPADVVCIAGPDRGRRVAFRRGRLKIGRSRASDFRVSSEVVSADHVKISYVYNRFWLEDLGSSNGTWIEGQKVTGKIPLSYDIQFKIGPDLFTLVSKGKSSPRLFSVGGLANRAIDKIATYEHKQMIHAGKEATVYRYAHHESIIAVKFIHTLDNQHDEGFRQALGRRLIFAQKIAHPHCSRVLGGNIQAELPYWIEEFAMNGSLQDRLVQGYKFDVREVVRIIGQCCDALHHLHKKGVLYQRISPSNILLDAQDAVRLIHFDAACVPGLPLKTTLPDPLYMSVEYARDRLPLIESDVYSLGTLAYHLLVGQPPFEGNEVELKERHIRTKPINLRLKDVSVPASLEQAVMKALAKNPAWRFHSTSEMARAFGFTSAFH